MGRLIDIDRLCDDLMERWSIADKKKEDTIRAVIADVVTPIVVSQPTVDAVPVVHGRWIKKGHIEHTWLVSKCSVCGNQTIDAGTYCTNCGARMDGKDGEHAEGTIQKERS